jgi:hypothetical protein
MPDKEESPMVRKREKAKSKNRKRRRLCHYTQALKNMGYKVEPPKTPDSAAT